MGESQQRLYALPAWRETPFYTDRERAALAWTEAITLISQGHAPDDVFEQARPQFTEAELVNLTMAIIAINGRNRLVIGFREVPGTYQAQAGSNARWARCRFWPSSNDYPVQDFKDFSKPMPWGSRLLSGVLSTG